MPHPEDFQGFQGQTHQPVSGTVSEHVGSNAPVSFFASFVITDLSLEKHELGSGLSSDSAGIVAPVNTRRGRKREVMESRPQPQPQPQPLPQEAWRQTAW